MLIEQESNKPALSVVRKPGIKVIKMNPLIRLPNRKKEIRRLLPPRDEFNTGYLKGRDNDPL